MNEGFHTMVKASSLGRLEVSARRCESMRVHPGMRENGHCSLETLGCFRLCRDKLGDGRRDLIPRCQCSKLRRRHCIDDVRLNVPGNAECSTNLDGFLCVGRQLRAYRLQDSLPNILPIGCSNSRVSGLLNARGKVL